MECIWVLVIIICIWLYLSDEVYTRHIKELERRIIELEERVRKDAIRNNS